MIQLAVLSPTAPAPRPTRTATKTIKETAMKTLGDMARI